MRSHLLSALLVGVGGFVGAIFRHTVSGLVHRQIPMAGFPHGTLSVNLLGCALIGALAGLADSRQLFSPELRAFAFIGLIGGFTTFSTLAYETMMMARAGDYLRAASNLGLHVGLGLALVWMAYGLTSSR